MASKRKEERKLCLVGVINLQYSLCCDPYVVLKLNRAAGVVASSFSNGRRHQQIFGKWTLHVVFLFVVIVFLLSFLLDKVYFIFGFHCLISKKVTDVKNSKG